MPGPDQRCDRWAERGGSGPVVGRWVSGLPGWKMSHNPTLADLQKPVFSVFCCPSVRWQTVSQPAALYRHVGVVDITARGCLPSSTAALRQSGELARVCAAADWTEKHVRIGRRRRPSPLSGAAYVPWSWLYLLPLSCLFLVPRLR